MSTGFLFLDPLHHKYIVDSLVVIADLLFYCGYAPRMPNYYVLFVGELQTKSEPKKKSLRNREKLCQNLGK